MIANIKERKVIESAVGLLYKNGSKIAIRDVPVGSVIIVETPEEDEFVYQILIVYRKMKDIVRCAFDYYGQIEDDLRVAPNEKVVILNGALPQAYSIPPRLEQKPISKEEVQSRTRNAVIVCEKGEYYLSQVTHTRQGVPLSGWVVEGEWRLHIRDGAFHAASNKEPLFTVDEFSVVYIPKRIRDSGMGYEEVLDWALETVPPEYRVVHKIESKETAYDRG